MEQNTNKTKIYIIRHTEAEGNIFRRIHGHYDGQVTLTGRKQIEALRERFLDVAVDAVYSSDLTRAYQTALAVAEPKGLTVTKLPELREISMGVWEDTCWGYWEMFDQEQMDYYNLNPLKWRVDGCESISAVQKRIVDAVTQIAERHYGESVAVVTHGVALRTLLCYVNGIALDDVNEIRYCDNTAVSLFTVADDGKFTVEYMNDNSHLPTEISTFARQNWWKNKNVTDGRNLYFEPLTPDDAGIAYLTLVYSDSDADYGDAPAERLAEFLDAQKARAVDAPDCLLYAMHYGKPCGLVIMDAKRYADDNSGYVGLFYLEPEFRRRGFGVQLLGCAVSRFRAAGLNRIRLFVSENNRLAIKFYERYGFARLPELDETMNGVRHLAYEMTI
ncbi:MAG: GNAT family N-acetyltransferase [Oscillospiraceae bacterium]|jgi:probable phosphoglycerate mutase|nr:GNAT family N-acetyltransferase [Oscillospiraceae bacterium]